MNLYEVHSNRTIFVFDSLKKAVKRTIEREKNGFGWSITQKNNAATIYREPGPHKSILTLSLPGYLSPNTKVSSYRLDLNLKERYNSVRLEILIEEDDMHKPTYHYVTNDEYLKKMKVTEEEFNFYILDRNCAIQKGGTPSSFLAWYRNRSPNRTKRGIRLFFDKTGNKQDGTTRFISTVFMGAVHKDEFNGGLPPMFETLVVMPDDQVFFVWRYNNFKDAEEGHTALKSASYEDLKLQIESEYDETGESVANVSQAD